MNQGTGARDARTVSSASSCSTLMRLGHIPTRVHISATQDFISILRNNTTFFPIEQAMKAKYDRIDSSGPGSTRSWLRSLLPQRQTQQEDETGYNRDTNAPPPYETASLFAEKSSRLKPGAIEDFYDHLPETPGAERHGAGETCCRKVERALEEFKSFPAPTFSKILAIIPGRDLSCFRNFLYRQLRREYTPSSIAETEPSAEDKYFHSLGQVLCTESGHQRLFGSQTLNGALQHELNKNLEADYYKHVRALGVDEYHVRRTIISASRTSRGLPMWRYLVERMAEKGAFETMLTKLENDLKTLEATASSCDDKVEDEVRAAIVDVRAKYFDIDNERQAVQLTRFARTSLCPNCSCNQSVSSE